MKTKKFSSIPCRGIVEPDFSQSVVEDMHMHLWKALESLEKIFLTDRRDFMGVAAALTGTCLLGFGIPAAGVPAGDAQDRMPPIPADKMTDAQKKAAAELISGKRGKLEGPFIPLLRSPEFMSRLQKTGEYLRFNTKLGPNISELTILLTARHWTQQVEWSIHEPIAAQAGIKPEIITAIAEGRRPEGMQADQEIAYDFCTELFHQQGVSDATYHRAVTRFGEQGVIDLTGLCGYYSLLGMILNVARTSLPPGQPQRLGRLPD